MRRDKSTFILSSEYESFTDDMTDEEAGILFKAILRHENGGEVENLPPAVKIVWSFIRKRLDDNKTAYEAACEAHREARVNGVEKNKPEQKVTKRTKGNKQEQKPIDNENDNENENDKSKDREKRASAFTPPTVEEVRAYCQERHNDVNPEKWWDFYQSKNWMIGNNKMKDWKAAVRTWEQRDSRAAPAKKPSYPQRSYDFAEMERQLIKN